MAIVTDDSSLQNAAAAIASTTNQRAQLEQQKAQAKHQADYDRAMLTLQQAAGQRESAKLAYDQSQDKYTPLPPEYARPIDPVKNPAQASAQAYNAAMWLTQNGKTKADEDRAKDLRLTAASLATTADIYQGKIPVAQSQVGLNKAKTDRELHWRDELKSKFDQQLRLVQTRGDIQAYNQMQHDYRAASAAMERTQYTQGQANGRAQMSNEVREAIAYQTALNASNRLGFQANLRTALAQYQGMERNYAQQEGAHMLSPDTVPDPGAPPSMPPMTFNIQGPPVAGMPQIIMLAGQQPGAGGQPTGGQPPGGGGAQHDPKQTQALVERARTRGANDAQITAAMSKDGYAPTEIAAALASTRPKRAAPARSNRGSNQIQGLNLSPGGGFGLGNLPWNR